MTRVSKIVSRFIPFGIMSDLCKSHDSPFMFGNSILFVEVLWVTMYHVLWVAMYRLMGHHVPRLIGHDVPGNVLKTCCVTTVRKSESEVKPFCLIVVSLLSCHEFL